jgi:hypothetical protein
VARRKQGLVAALLVVGLLAVTASPPPRPFVLAPLDASPRPPAPHPVGDSAAAATPAPSTAPVPTANTLPTALSRAIESEVPAFHRAVPPGRPVRVLVVGDSVGITLGRGLELWSRESGRIVVQNQARKWCSLGRYLPRVAGYGPDHQGDGCDDWQTRWSRSIDQFDPDVVVVLYTILEIAQWQLPGASEFTVPGTPAHDAWQRAEYDTAADVLGAHGANVVWLTIPCTPSFPSNRGSPTWFVNEHTITGVARDRPFVRVLDLDGQLCPGHGFRNDYGGIDPARPDGNHFSDEGALAVARWMAPILLGDVPPPITPRAQVKPPLR